MFIEKRASRKKDCMHVCMWAKLSVHTCTYFEGLSAVSSQILVCMLAGDLMYVQGTHVCGTLHALHGVGVRTVYVLSSCTHVGRAAAGLEDLEDGELCGMCTCI